MSSTKPSAKFAPKLERYIVPLGADTALTISVSVPYGVTLDVRGRKRAIKRALFAHTRHRVKTATVYAILKFNRELYEHAEGANETINRAAAKDAGEDPGAAE